MDIVERLRQEIGGYTDVHLEKTETDMREAADEIERLRQNKRDLLTQVQMLRQSMDWIKSLIFGIEQRLMSND